MKIFRYGSGAQKYFESTRSLQKYRSHSPWFLACMDGLVCYYRVHYTLEKLIIITIITLYT